MFMIKEKLFGKRASISSERESKKQVEEREIWQLYMFHQKRLLGA